MAVVGEVRNLVEQTSVDQVEFVRVEETVSTIAFPSMSTAGVSIGPDMALVLASSSSPPPIDEVVLEFDATHCMSKLPVAWENLAARTTSFGEML
jgi:hypothetical protein